MKRTATDAAIAACLFKAARAAGVKNYFVEQNMELTRESVAALRAMKV